MSARRRFDMGRFAAMSKRPGVDPRIWLTWAVVTELGYDSDQGIFADVTFQPTGEQETVILGGPYAGDGFGFYLPVEVGDVVLIAVPNGDSNAGPYVVGRAWRGADKPSSDFKAEQPVDGSDVPSSNSVLRMRSGKKFLIRTSGDGGDLDFKVEGGGSFALENVGAGVMSLKTGTGDMTLVTGLPGVLKLQDASQAYVRGDNYADALGTFLDAAKIVMTAVGAFATAVGAALPPVIPAAATLNVAIVAFNAACDAFKASRLVYLSSRIKGQ